MYSWPTGVTSGSDTMSMSEVSGFSSLTVSPAAPSTFTVPRFPAATTNSDAQINYYNNLICKPQDTETRVLMLWIYNSHATKLILGVDMTVFLTPAPVVVVAVVVLTVAVPAVRAFGSPLGSG